MTQKTVLLIKHSNTWSGDRCSAWFENNGYRLQWCYPCDGDVLPEPKLFDTAVIFGGRNSANDHEDWIVTELKWLESCLKSRCRFFGICLGAQMLAKVLGARVWAHPQGLKEIGFTEINPTDGAGSFLTQPMKLFQWHGDGFDLPAGADLLATSERFPHQAYRYGVNALSVQFHPEVNLNVASQWFSMNDDYESEFLDRESRVGHLDYAKRHDDQITAWFDNMMSEWLLKDQRTVA
ncbi:MAG: glutamine amidotransferase [Pseudomonadota bacterium]